MTKSTTAPVDDPKEVAKAMAELERVRALAKGHFAKLIAAAKERQAFATVQKERWTKRRAELAAFKNATKKPEHNTYVSVDMLTTLYAQWQRRCEIEIVTNQANLKLLDFEGVPSALVYTNPLLLPEYLEAQCREHLANGRYLVRFHIQGIDAVLRATNQGQTINPIDAADREKREGRANTLRAGAQANLASSQFLAQLGADLATVRTLLKWGATAFKTFDKADAAAKSKVLQDPRWSQLADLIPLLQQLHPKTAPFPLIQQYMAKWELDKQPFSVLDVGPGPFATPPAPSTTKGPDGVSLPVTTGTRASSLQLKPGKKGR